MCVFLFIGNKELKLKVKFFSRMMIGCHHGYDILKDNGVS